jgi:putative addiction module component (TIGR02574 family)
VDKATALQAVRQWPVDEQLEFIQQVWDQIAETGWQPELTDEQKAELDRRLAAHQADPTNVLTWEEVLAHLRRPR